MPLHFRQCLTTNLYRKPPICFLDFFFLVWDLTQFLSSAYFFLSCTEYWNVNKTELQDFFLFGCFSRRYNKERLFSLIIRKANVFVHWVYLYHKKKDKVNMFASTLSTYKWHKGRQVYCLLQSFLQTAGCWCHLKSKTRERESEQAD